MKHTFVLDENVLISASTGKDSYDQKDYSSSLLVLEIAERCHKIAWNYELKKKYSEKSDTLLKSPVASLFMRASAILFHLLANPDKNVHNENYLHLDSDLNDDRHVISLAIFTGGVLVTEDLKLRENLHKKNLVDKYKLIIVKPSEALSIV